MVSVSRPLRWTRVILSSRPEPFSVSASPLPSLLACIFIYLQLIFHRCSVIFEATVSQLPTLPSRLRTGSTCPSPIARRLLPVAHLPFEETLGPSCISLCALIADASSSRPSRWPVHWIKATPFPPILPSLSRCSLSYAFRTSVFVTASGSGTGRWLPMMPQALGRRRACPPLDDQPE